MFTISCDGYIIHDPRLQDYQVTNAVLRQELNKADTLTFTIYPSNPNFSVLSKLKSDIVVSEGDTVRFRGRILNESVGWNNEKKIVCEGALAWLNDTIQRPFEFPVDSSHTTPADYFEFLLSRHNSQSGNARKVTIGICTVTDPNGYIARSDTEYSTTWQLLSEGLIDTLGGYIVPTYTANGVRIDYLADFDVLASQSVSYGINLLSINTDKRGEEVCTAILPLGAMDEESGERLTIGSISDGTYGEAKKSGDIVYSQQAETAYGSRIIKVVRWDDVTQAQNLLTKAREKLAQEILMPQTVTLEAADLSAAGYDCTLWSLGTYVSIYDSAHEVDHSLSPTYLVSKLSIDLLSPENNKITLGATVSSLTDGQRRGLSAGLKVVEVNTEKELAKVIREIETRYSSAILQSENAILIKVANDTYTKGDVDGLIESVSTQITTTADGIDLRFTNMQKDLDDVADGADARFETLESFIQIANGIATFGRVGDEISLVISNNKISIKKGGVTVTEWSSDTMLTPQTLEVPLGGRQILGNFAFIPRTNGSLDFTWIGA